MSSIAARPAESGSRIPLTGVVLAWLAAVIALAAAGVFDGPEGRPPYEVVLAIAVPVVTVAVLLNVSAAFRARAAAMDLGLLTQIQAWRIAGFGFVALYSVGALPGSFALPAGWGDVAVGLTALYVAHRLLHRRGLVAAWNVLGVLDLAVAITFGVLNGGGPLGALTGEISTGPVLTTLPVVLVPMFGVPLALIVHMLSLHKLRTEPAVVQPAELGAVSPVPAGRHTGR